MNTPSLRDSLDRWVGFPKIDRAFEPRRTRAAAAGIAKRLGDVQPKAPEPYDLETLHRRANESWRRYHSLDRLSTGDLRRLPWVLFYSPPDAGRARWLGARPRFVQEYGRWLSEGGRTRSTLALLHEFLRVYPVDLPTFDDLRRLLENTIQGPSSAPPPSLKRWRQRCKDYGFLKNNGGRSFVNQLMTAADAAPEEILRQAGIDAGLARCGFLESGVRSYLPDVRARLTNNRFGDARLERLLSLLECDGKLRFDEPAVRVRTAVELLGPFVDQSPKPEVKERLQSFFLRHFGDPRLRSGKHKWSGVPDDVTRVVIRWLVERVLEQFFLLVKETALDRHWRYREAFWRAFLARELIEDIWFVLGRRAADVLRKMNKNDGGLGTTSALRGGQSDQSVLLFRMPGVTIAEWSHNGSCHMWLDGTSGTPGLYKNTYFANELRHTRQYHRIAGAHLQAHMGSEYGRWQDKIAKWLRDNTGVRIERDRYFPPTLRRSERSRSWRSTFR